MSTTAPTQADVATEVARFVAQLGNEKMPLDDLSDRVQALVNQHPDVASTRFTPTGKKGSGVLEALGADYRLIASVKIKASGEVDVIMPKPSGSLDADTPGTVRGLLWSVMPASAEQLVSKVLDEIGVEAESRPTRAMADRAKNPPSGLRGKARILYVVQGAGIVDQIKKAQGDNELKRAAQATANRSAASKRAGTAPPARKSKYLPEITDAVRRAKDARGTTNGAPGAKQHVLTRDVIASGKFREGVEAMGVADVTVERILDAAGVRSAKALRDLADGTADKTKLKALQPLGKAIPDGFCGGRNLASMLVAWVEQIGATAKAGK